MFSEVSENNGASTDKGNEPAENKPEGLSKNKIKRSRERIVEIEETIRRIEEKKKTIESEMNEEGFYKDMDSANAKITEHDGLGSKKEQLEEEGWS